MSGPANPNAFPQPYADDGMSLRDWFAGHLAAAELASAGANIDAAEALAVAAEQAGQTIPQRIAFNAYEVAEALLEARARRLPPEAAAPSEFPEVFNEDMGAAPQDGTNLMGRFAEGVEHPMTWWLNWPGWRRVSNSGALGEPVGPLAWRPLTLDESLDIDIPF